MKRAALLAAVLTLLGAGSASAQTTIIGPPIYQEWIDESEVPSPAVTITVIDNSSRCDAELALACTVPGEDTIWMGEQITHDRRLVFEHEVGHNFDAVMPNWVRVRYMSMLGKTGLWEEAWRLHYSPNEMFAESYAFCAVDAVLPPNGSIDYQHPIGGAMIHNRVCRMIERL